MFMPFISCMSEAIPENFVVLSYTYMQINALILCSDISLRSSNVLSASCKWKEGQRTTSFLKGLFSLLFKWIYLCFNILYKASSSLGNSHLKYLQVA